MLRPRSLNRPGPLLCLVLPGSTTIIPDPLCHARPALSCPTPFGHLCPPSLPAPTGDLLINICTTLPPSPLRHAKPSRVAGPPHPTPCSARVARGLCARAKNYGRRERRFSAVTMVVRSLTLAQSILASLSHSSGRLSNCLKPTKPPSPADIPIRNLIIA